MSERLTDLEVRYAYLERALSDLDAVVVELRGEIDALRRRLARLEAMAREVPEDAPANEKPPHY